MLVKLLVLALFGFAAATSVVEPRCTIPDRVPALRLPHETDCARHWICQGGSKHLMPPCPPGNLFDTPSMSCRPAADAICGPAAETTPPPTTPPPVGTDGPTDEPTTVPPTTAPPTDVPPTGGPSTAPPINPTVSGESLIRRKSENPQKLMFYFSVLPPTAPTVNPENPPTEPPAEPPTEPPEEPEEPPTEASVIEREAPRRS
jgi:Chitin binding Peritrophin-A domain